MLYKANIKIKINNFWSLEYKSELFLIKWYYYWIEKVIKDKQ